MANIRVYAVIDANTSPFLSDPQWTALFLATAAEQPLAKAIRIAATAAHNDISTKKRTLGAGFVNRATMLGFEVDEVNVSAIVTIVNTQAAIRGLPEPPGPDRFEAVLQAEIKEEAGNLGHTEALVSISRWTHADRETAIAQAQSYLASFPAIWYE